MVRSIEKQKFNLYKTMLCDRHMFGWPCTYQNRCRYAHSFEELRLPTYIVKRSQKMCRNWAQTGYCIYGVQCHFHHSDSIMIDDTLLQQMSPCQLLLQSTLSSMCHPKLQHLIESTTYDQQQSLSYDQDESMLPFDTIWYNQQVLPFDSMCDDHQLIQPSDSMLNDDVLYSTCNDDLLPPLATTYYQSHTIDSIQQYEQEELPSPQFDTTYQQSFELDANLYAPSLPRHSPSNYSYYFDLDGDDHLRKMEITLTPFESSIDIDDVILDNIIVDDDIINQNNAETIEESRRLPVFISITSKKTTNN